MLEKLKDISKILIVFWIILYFFGFLTVSSFLARFGIVSFDVLNSKFIIAGIFSIISIIFIILATWKYYDDIMFDKIFKKENITNRIGAYLSIYFFTYVVSFAAANLLNLGIYSPPQSQDKLLFSPLFGEFDFIGNFIAAQYINISPAANYILKFVLNLSFYGIFVAIVFFALAFIFKKIAKKEKKEVTNTQSATESSPKDISGWLFQLLIIIEIIVLSIGIGLFSYSFSKLRVNFFDFNSFYNPKLSSGLFFSWAFTLVVAIYTFISMLGISRKKMTLSLFKNIMATPATIQGIIQAGIVPVLTAIIIFGQVIYPRIPYSIGGGQPREITIELRNNLLDNFSNSYNTYIIGESSEFIFIIVLSDDGGKEAFQINKDEVIAIKTKK